MLKKSLPNVFTILNLFLGIVAIILVYTESHSLAAIMVIVAMLMDGLDGRVARALNAQSEFGKELDSLSDVISFGVAPAFIMYVVAFSELNPPTAWITTALFPICGAMRLARFNVVEAPPGYFVGLPIPAAGGLLCTLALFHQELPTYILVGGSILLSLLMVSSIKYPSFKKVKVPQGMLWLVGLTVASAIFVSIRYPGTWSKLVFVPLVLYALYGTLQSLRKKR
ncbi:CDP-diacylglycerol--serine O-phosphatidyltransferase [Paenibacillus senegalensis]|uniref:CDP-diacylglycerol--serine O-phosphatidyltransferase n=1 Tax=Paenibacillus senegalensis TaxID=1465766 RepID=UPI0002888AD9|nr:CDP-diacylglycerol--serine O-phosphatidyltransferase [Paenibacillus senegalensis]